MNLFLKTAIQAAREAGKIQKRHLGKIHSIRFKGEINLVTEVDQMCEDKVIGILAKQFPDHEILAEESGLLKAKNNNRYKWFIDPLDGTTNYAHGYPVFCVSIGLAFRNQVILGVVYDPTRNELFWAEKGKGARLNGKKIRVSPTGLLKRSLLSTGFAYNLKTETDNNFTHFANFLLHAQAVRRDGAAAIDLCYVACGRDCGFWELDLKPWDTAAASLILREAGGRVSTFSGGPFDLYGREIVASHGKIHRDMVKILHGRRSGKPADL